MMKIQSLLFVTTIIFLSLMLQGCPSTETHEETVTIHPSNWNTLTETSSGGDVCRGGLQPDSPGANQIIVGFSHRLSDDDCWVNQIYEGLLRFQIDAAPFNRRLVKSATLTSHAANTRANPARNSCINQVGMTDIDWWAQLNPSRIHLTDLRNLKSVQPAQDLSIDVTQIVSRWANGTEDNNGFVLIGQRPEMSDFSNTGMLTNETCESFYENMALTVTFFQFNTQAHHPSISVTAVHTQTSSDITVKGTDFTPNGTVHVFADDVPGRMGSFPLGSVTADGNGKFQFFNRALCTHQPDSVTIRTLDDSSGDNARGYAPVFCY
ncbi:MAG: hypothetical protein SFW66_02170 [Gammaproteobacteria bacterium]|nr:hypothetical protein [Gammaproteobacteria bacterium]